MNFSLILAIEFPKKKIMEVLRIENLKYDKNFQFTHCFLTNTPLFAFIEQKSKAEVRKQPFIYVS